MRGALNVMALLALVGAAGFIWGSEKGAVFRERVRTELRAQVYGDEGGLPTEGPRALPGKSPPNALRVLFVGNSHTRSNGMPGMIAGLARAAGSRPLFKHLVAPGGASFRRHLNSGRVTELLASEPWNVLVLQEQQQWPSFGADQREREMNAPARVFDQAAKAAGARTVLMMSWARRDGDLHNRTDDSFEAMHGRVVLGYRELAKQLDASIAPVAIAWKQAHAERPELTLWSADGMHAAPAGSYLAACVLYQSLYGRPALGIPFSAGLKTLDAQFLQSVAASVHAATNPSW